MTTETEGIILRQTKTLNGRMMITLLTLKYGKISAGTSVPLQGKKRSNQSLRPFCFGRYEIFKGRESYSISAAETINSHYSLGEDVDKYMAAAYALELTDGAAEENDAQPAVFRLLSELLDMLEKRNRSFDTLLIAYRIKLLDLLGSGIELDHCVRCGKPAQAFAVISAAEGGAVCGDCLRAEDAADPKVFSAGSELIKMIRYIQKHPLSAMEGIAVGDQQAAVLKKVLDVYFSWHLGISDLKSEGLKI